MPAFERRLPQQGNDDSPAGTPPASSAGNQAFVSGALQSSHSAESFGESSKPPLSLQDSYDAVAAAIDRDAHSFTQPDQQALLTPLPESNGDDSVGNSRPSSKSSSAKNGERWESYGTTIRKLSSFMPHLRNVQKGGTVHKRVAVSLIDYLPDTVRSDGLHTFEDDGFSDFGDLEDTFKRVVTGDIRADVRARLILVEDLSPDLISLLGQTFHLNPEFFEEHLINSGWSDGLYGDPEPTTWNTRRIDRNYTSIRWYRPIKPLKPSLVTALSMVHRSELMNDAGFMSEWRKEHGGARRRTSWKSMVNIMRSDWDLSPKASTNSAVTGSRAWLEKMSICTAELDEFPFVIILLDPLPEVQESKTRLSDEVSEAATTSSQSITNAVYGDDGASSRGSQAQHESGIAHNSASCLSDGAPEINTHDLPLATANAEDVDPEKALRTQVAPSLEASVHRATSPKASGELISALYRRMPWFKAKAHKDAKPLIVDDQAATGEPDRKRKAKVANKTRYPLMGFAPRHPLIDPTQFVLPHYRSRLQGLMTPTQSTGDAIRQVVELTPRQPHGKPAEPLTTLCMIVERDTMHILDLMDLALTELGRSILDDSSIQRQVDHWRSLLNQYDDELRHMEEALTSLSDFVDTTRKIFMLRTDQDERPSAKKIFAKLQRRIPNVRQRTKNADTSLLTTMSLVESKRGIAEAESITKLTELAFFFIPLTFSASIFSMQIKELSASDTSITLFIIVAVLITLGSYTLRLLVRSTWLATTVKRIKGEIRADANIPPSVGIPTTSLFLWLYHRAHEILRVFVTVPRALVAASTILTAGLLAGIWSRSLEITIKAVVTVAISLLFFVTLVFIGLIHSSSFRSNMARSLRTKSALST